jgi:hypothetical protein
MRTLDAPFLELGFYFADLTDADAFAKVARALMARGSRFLFAQGWRGPGKRSQPFESIRGDELREPLSIREDQLEKALADPDLRIMEISYDHIIGISKAPERLEYFGVFSEIAAQLDRHPIEILAEGQPWSGPHDSERGRKPGKKVYQFFRELVVALAPSYAAITVEAPIECPTDLHQDPSNHTFLDFYMSESFIGASNLATIARLYDGAYQERVADGLYISTYRYMNPGDVSLDYEKVSYMASEVGRLVGQRRPVRA